VEADVEADVEEARDGREAHEAEGRSCHDARRMKRIR
jgi:hypothetical protein